MADPMLTGANITFHTNDDNKDGDTAVFVMIDLGERKMRIAKLGLKYGKFNDHSDAGPFDMVVLTSVTREQLKRGEVTISIQPLLGGDTWRFNFLVDMLFSDGGHLIARANGIELSTDFPSQTFGIE